MRVTISHQEQKGRRNNKYLINLAVEFSETEKAIIRERKLGNNFIRLEPAILESSEISNIKILLLGNSGRLMFAAIILTFIPKTTIIGILGLAITIPLFAYAKYVKYFYKGQRNTITLKELIYKPATLLTYNPVQAKEADMNIRENLDSLKTYLSDAEYIKPQDTFDL